MKDLAVLDGCTMAKETCKYFSLASIFPDFAPSCIPSFPQDIACRVCVALQVHG